MTDYALSFTTSLSPTKKFLVDGEEFDLLGLDHLSDEEEAEVMALFARFNLLQEELAMTANVEKGKGVAAKIQTARLAIVCKLTSLTPEVAAKLSLPQVTKLMETIEAEIEAKVESEGGE